MTDCSVFALRGIMYAKTNNMILNERTRRESRRHLEEGASLIGVVLIVLLAVTVVGGGVAFSLYDDSTDQQAYEQRSAEVDALLDELREQRSLLSAQFDQDVFVTVVLEDGSVTSAVLEDGSVTAGKLSSGAIALFPGGNFGRIVLGEGDVLEVHLKDGSVRTGEILDAAVTTATLRDGSIREVALQDGSVSGAKLEDGSITTFDIATGAVTEAKLASGVVTSAKLVHDSVTSTTLADDAVGASELATGAVGTEQISDLAVTAAKIATGTITATQVREGDVITAISGNSIVQVSEDEGAYSLSLLQTCSSSQVLSWDASAAAWTCSDASGGVTLASASGLQDTDGLAIDVNGDTLTLGANGLSVSDTFVRNDGSDSTSGTLSMASVVLSPTTTAPTAEGSLYYDSGSASAYVRTSGGLVDLAPDAYSTTEESTLLAALADSSDVYLKTETYSQSEVTSALSGGGSVVGAVERVANVQAQDFRTGGDLGTNNEITLYTVPTGKTFEYVRLLVVKNSGDTASDVTLGTNSTSFNNLHDGFTLPSSDNTYRTIDGAFSSFSSTDIPVFTAGTSIALRVGTPATSANSYDIQLYGIVYDE